MEGKQSDQHFRILHLSSSVITFLPLCMQVSFQSIWPSGTEWQTQVYDYLVDLWLLHIFGFVILWLYTDLAFKAWKTRPLQIWTNMYMKPGINWILQIRKQRMVNTDLIQIKLLSLLCLLAIEETVSVRKIIEVTKS